MFAWAQPQQNMLDFALNTRGPGKSATATAGSPPRPRSIQNPKDVETLEQGLPRDRVRRLLPLHLSLRWLLHLPLLLRWLLHLVIWHHLHLSRLLRQLLRGYLGLLLVLLGGSKKKGKKGSYTKRASATAHVFT